MKLGVDAKMSRLTVRRISVIIFLVIQISSCLGQEDCRALAFKKGSSRGWRESSTPSTKCDKGIILMQAETTEQHEDNGGLVEEYGHFVVEFFLGGYYLMRYSRI